MVWRGVAWAVLFASCAAAAQSGPQAAPSFAELEAAGAVIGRIVLKPLDIFDLDDPREDNRLFRLANRLHIQTRPETIRRQLLFKPGERVSLRRIEETERLLRSNHYLHDVQIVPLEYRDGVVDIEVRTRDTWTLDPGFSVSRAGGTSSQRAYLKDYNLLGSGVSLGISTSSNVDRAGTELEFSDHHFLAPWTALSASVGRLSDGRQWALSLARPFYALDTRWAGGAAASDSDVLNSVFEKGVRTAQYRARQQAFDAYGGWSTGWVDGWTRRFYVGVNRQASEYALEPGAAAPAMLPADRTLAGPYVRYELIEEDFDKVVNRDHIGRLEYFDRGLHLNLQLGRSFSGLGSTEESWLYSASLTKGWRSFGSHTLLVSGAMSARLDEGSRRNQLVSGSARYLVPQGKDALLSLTASGDVYRSPDLPAPLQLGGDTGLRGYPLSYQSGERRVLLTVEQRVYSDWYPFRLVRVGGAAFVDVGRAWHGLGAQTAGERTLSDLGFGLRLQSARSARGSVLHADIAAPLNARDQVKSVQFLLKSYTSF